MYLTGKEVYYHPQKWGFHTRPGFQVCMAQPLAIGVYNTSVKFGDKRMTVAREIAQTHNQAPVSPCWSDPKYTIVYLTFRDFRPTYAHQNSKLCFIRLGRACSAAPPRCAVRLGGRTSPSSFCRHGFKSLCEIFFSFFAIIWL